MTESRPQSMIMYYISQGAPIRGRIKLMNSVFLLEYYDYENNRLCNTPKFKCFTDFSITVNGAFDFDVVSTFKECVEAGRISEEKVLGENGGNLNLIRNNGAHYSTLTDSEEQYIRNFKELYTKTGDELGDQIHYLVENGDSKFETFK